jgi:hypothetical protein
MYRGDIAGLSSVVSVSLQISSKYPNCLAADWIPGRSRRPRNALLGKVIGHMKAVRSVLEGCIIEGGKWADTILVHLESNKQGCNRLTMVNSMPACLQTGNSPSDLLRGHLGRVADHQDIRTS